ncbi:hypothetical protein BY996DRAFT_6445444 [Phakopsora pachyrhizi]|nr:hypothetical protein BY996DRAFT_6445444 [Phakopsora pachyrhizi]
MSVKAEFVDQDTRKEQDIKRGGEQKYDQETIGVHFQNHSTLTAHSHTVASTIVQ